MQPTTDYLPERLEELANLIARAHELCQKSCTLFATSAKLAAAGTTTLEEGLKKNLHDTALALSKAISLSASTAIEAQPLGAGVDSLLQAVTYSLEAALQTGFSLGAGSSSVDAARAAHLGEREINTAFPTMTSAFVARGLLLSFARQSTAQAIARLTTLRR